MTKYVPSRDLPEFARLIKSTSPSKLVQVILEKRNVKKSECSVTNWWTRNPEVKAEVEAELSANSPTLSQPVGTSLFENGNFREVSSVKQWILDMKSRRRKNRPLNIEYIYNSQVSPLKRVCRNFSKHPSRLNFRDAQEIFALMESQCNMCDTILTQIDKEGYGFCSKCNSRQRNKDTYELRRVLKDFLKSKNEEGWQKIGVGKPRGFGDYKDLNVPEETAEKMLNWIREQRSAVNSKDHKEAALTEAQAFEAYAMDKLMLYRGLRINAVETALIENFVKVDGAWYSYTLKVLEKFRDVKTFKIAPEIADLIKQVIGERSSGLIFSLEDGIMEGLNNAAINLFCSELRIKYKHIHPNHLWRHECIQLLLDLWHHNTSIVAAIVQCSEQSLKESYGAATETDIDSWEQESLRRSSQL